MPCYNIDQADDFADCEASLRHPGAKNFVVEFSSAEATCTVDLSLGNVSDVLEKRRTNPSQICLWINLWGHDAQHADIVKVISQVYDITPRLAHTICPRPGKSFNSVPRRNGGGVADESKSKCISQSESSYGTPLSEDAVVKAGKRTWVPTSIIDIAQNLWHYCTVDYGQLYICICWNALFFLEDDDSTSEAGKPDTIRVWSSVLICKDGTVLSTFESPLHLSQQAQASIRQNQLNIFSHLSKQVIAKQNSDTALMQVHIRQVSETQSQNHSADQSNMASLLFYYLLDDWMHTYYQAIGGPHSCRHELDNLRKQMEASANVKQISRLHEIGRELVRLRAVYRSYQSVIERILQQNRGYINPLALGNQTRHPQMTDSWTSSQSNMQAVEGSMTGVMQLSPNALSRFERLLDRIGLCAVTEVEECLKEKEELVMMNFNLVSLKEAQTVEKLTRATVLLAKVTIVFLPLSLVTGYFSMQLIEINNKYSINTYWFTSLVVLVLTLLFTASFGWLSDRYKGSMEFIGLTRTWLRRRRRQVGGTSVVV